MNTFFRLILLSTTLVLQANAETPTLRTEEGSISLDQALHQVLSETPGLIAQRDLIEAARRDRLTRWLPREPSFSYADNDTSASQQYSLSLTVPFPLKLWSAHEADNVKLENAEREYHARVQENFRIVTQAFLGCSSARETLKLTEQTGADLSALSTFVSRQYESGFSSQAEKIGIELQLAQSRADIENARVGASSSCRRWNDVTEALLGTSLPAPADLPNEFPKDLIDSLGADSVETLRAEQTYTQAIVDVNNAAWMQSPDITFSVSRNHYTNPVASPTAELWTSNYMVSVTVPIFFLWNERTEAQRARAIARQAQEASHIARAQATVDQGEACQQWLRNRRRVDELLKHDLPMAEAWIESSETAYRRGRIGFAEILLTRKTLFDLRSQLVQAKSNSISSFLSSLGAKCS